MANQRGGEGRIEESYEESGTTVGGFGGGEDAVKKLERKLLSLGMKPILITQRVQRMKNS
jgi:hypothetical protein